MTDPVCKAHMTDDHEAFLSVNCTMGCVMRKPGGVKMTVRGVLENQRLFGIKKF